MRPTEDVHRDIMTRGRDDTTGCDSRDDDPKNKGQIADSGLRSIHSRNNLEIEWDVVEQGEEATPEEEDV